MLLLTACTLFAPPGVTPEERLDAVVPGLAEAASRYVEDLEPLADLVEAADPDLARLLLTHAPGLVEDRVGEADEGELYAASIAGGPIVTGRIEGEGAAALLFDTRGGPAPDLRVTLGEVLLAQPMDGWRFGPAVPVPGSFDGTSFTVDLTAYWEKGHTGAVTAAVRAGDTWDHGPAGRLGTPEPHAVALLVQLSPEDPDLAVAVALAYAPWRARVATQLRTVVEADAHERLAYGLGLDDWLTRNGGEWRLGSQPAMAKLLWASPGGEAVVYGALPLAWADEPLSLERYRFSVPSIESMETLRDDFPLDRDPGATARARDAASWERLLYRASDAGMEALCDQKLVSSRVCAAWRREKASSLGPVDGRSIPFHLATSVELQLDRLEEEREFVGDCATATTIALAAYQAVGLVPLGFGYAGEDWYYPTHNFPMWLDGDRFRATQAMPSTKWDADPTWAYAVVPPIDGFNGLTLGWEPDGWARGGSVAGGATTYGRLGQVIGAGLPLADVEAWVYTGAAGGWPQID